MIQRHIAETMNLDGFDFFNDAKDTADWLNGLKGGALQTSYDRLANELRARRMMILRQMAATKLLPNDPVTIRNTMELVTVNDGKPGIIIRQWSGYPEFFTVLVNGNTAVYHESQIHPRD